MFTEFLDFTEDMEKAIAAPGVTPWNPSRRAIQRVKSPLPAPTKCPYCQSHVGLTTNERIYGKRYGEWPWVYMCTRSLCGAYVGLHPFTNIPLGTLADARLRFYRSKAHTAFNPLWQGPGAPLSRTAAYQWLAAKLGIEDYNHCHIGWFDEATCNRVVQVSDEHRAKLKSHKT